MVNYTTVTTVAMQGWQPVVVMVFCGLLIAAFSKNNRPEIRKCITLCLFIMSVMAIVSIWVKFGWTETVTEIVPVMEVVGDVGMI